MPPSHGSWGLMCLGRVRGDLGDRRHDDISEEQREGLSSACAQVGPLLTPPHPPTLGVEGPSW